MARPSSFPAHLALALVTLPLLALVPVAAAPPRDIRVVNGDAIVKPGDTVGHVSTVNGDVRIGADASALSARSTNGEVHVGTGASVGPIETTNGAIVLGPKATSGALRCVNCTIQVGPEAVLTGGAQNVNGMLRAEGANLGGTVETTTGRILLLAGTRLDGTIRVAPPRDGAGTGGLGGLPGVAGWMELAGGSAATIVLGPEVTVTQPVVLDGETEVYVHETARVTIRGARAIRYAEEDDLPDGLLDVE